MVGLRPSTLYALYGAIDIDYRRRIEPTPGGSPESAAKAKWDNNSHNKKRALQTPERPLSF
jgi:hypothetical protein